MYAYELFKMFEKFNEKYPNINLSWRGFCVTPKPDRDILVIDYKITLNKLVLICGYDHGKKIQIKELFIILEKYKHKKIILDYSNTDLYLEIKTVEEIDYISLVIDFCFFKYKNIEQIRNTKYVERITHEQL